jgi:hypothetical protein
LRRKYKNSLTEAEEEAGAFQTLSKRVCNNNQTSVKLVNVLLKTNLMLVIKKFSSPKKALNRKAALSTILIYLLEPLSSVRLLKFMMLMLRNFMPVL